MSEPTTPKLDDLPFAGSLTFDLTLVLVGKATVRKLRIDYGYRPEWDYLDPETGSVVPGGPEVITTVVWLQVPPPPDYAETRYLADTRGRRIENDELFKPDNKPRIWLDWTDPRWVRADTLNEPQVLPSDMWELIDAAIDDRCRAEEQNRRINQPDSRDQRSGKEVKRSRNRASKLAMTRRR